MKVGAGKLGKLFELQDKKAKIVFKNGEEVICKPLHYLEPEEDELTYLVEVIDGLSYFPNDELLEVTEEEIKSVEETTR